MPQLNSTVPGQRYSRVDELNVKYLGNRRAEVKVTFRDHVPMTDGTHEPLGTPKLMRFEVTEEMFKNKVPLLDIDTGEPLGFDIDIETVFGGVNAAIRYQEAIAYPDPAPVVEVASEPVQN